MLFGLVYGRIEEEHGTTQHQKFIDDVHLWVCCLNFWCVYLHLNININLISENLLPDSSTQKLNQRPDQIFAEIIIDFLQTNRLDKSYMMNGDRCATRTSNPCPKAATAHS